MDANGTKFHLIHGRDDWGDCLIPDRRLRLRAFMAETTTPAGNPPDLEYVAGLRALRLRAQIREFVKLRISPSGDATGEALRRGAARDEAGNWYYIDEAQQEIRILAAGESVPAIFWRPFQGQATAGAGDFQPAPESPAPSAETPRAVTLRGLAMTTEQYLAVGLVEESRGALALIDLAGGSERLVEPPPAEPFVPHDIAAAADGGLWILDQENAIVWRLTDAHRFPSEARPAPVDFQPEVEATAPTEQAARAVLPPQTAQAQRFALPRGLKSAFAVERGPNGLAYLLVGEGGATTVVALDPVEEEAERFTVYRLPLPFEVADDGVSAPRRSGFHDLAYVEYGADCTPWLPLDVPPAPGQTVGVLVLAYLGGNQAIAYLTTPQVETDAAGRESLRLPAVATYLPMRRWQGLGLTAAGCRVYYDGETGWLPLQSFGETRYSRRGTLWTPADFPGNLPVQPFDGETYGCVWHRLLLDAEIPPGTRVLVRARAADDPSLLVQMPWRDHPHPYLRPGQAELPYYAPPAFRPPDPAAQPEDRPLDERCMPGDPFQQRLRERGAGTWEVLFQEVIGRYVQLELTLEGDGRATPTIYAVRAWYPRFSYLDRYLPALYQADPGSAAFLDRWLALFEGLFTGLEDRIEQFPALIDPRIAPAETLEWLAGWMGLLIDPQWRESQRRFFIRYAMEFYKLRGTLRGVEAALRLYLNTGPLDPAMFRADSPSWAVRLREDYQLAYVFAAYDAVTDSYRTLTPAERLQEQQEAAHRFTVLVPGYLTTAQQEMVRRIVELEKPAHTAYDIRQVSDQFIIGCAILDLDAVLCDAAPGKAAAPTLGADALAGLWLGPPPARSDRFRADLDMACEDVS